MNLKFNKININNLEQIRCWRMLPEVTKYMYSDPILTIDDQLNWYNLKVINNPKEKYWLINVDEKNIGLVNFYNIDNVNQRAYWAYYIAENGYQGKGIGKLVELNMLKYCFDVLKFNKLCCEVFCFNDMVIKLHEKFGSKVEGILRNHIQKNNKYFDIVTMGILKEEWQLIKTNHIFKTIEIE